MMDGKLEFSERESKTFAIFAHCFTCSKDVHAATRISRALTKMGISVLRFDFTGLGNSDGDFSNTNFSTNVSDLVIAYEYLSKHYQTPEILIGHSLGGAAILAGANSMENIKVIATIAAPSKVDHIEEIFGSKVSEIERAGQASVKLAGREFVIKKQFLDDVRSISLEGKLNRISASLLIFHSPEDQVVSVDHANEIYQAAEYPKSLISLQGASHMLDKAEDSELVADFISCWCKRYL